MVSNCPRFQKLRAGYVLMAIPHGSIDPCTMKAVGTLLKHRPAARAVICGAGRNRPRPNPAVGHQTAGHRRGPGRFRRPSTRRAVRSVSAARHRRVARPVLWARRTAVRPARPDPQTVRRRRAIYRARAPTARPFAGPVLPRAS